MISRLFHTVRHLRPVQIYHRARRVHRRGVSLRPAPARSTAGGAWQQSLQCKPPELGPNRFAFLNQEYEISGWNDAGVPRLWLYNLHYFSSPNASLIQRWIDGNPIGHGVGWEPYPLSLRIVNWIKWEFNGGLLDTNAVHSLASQARYLFRTLEYHLLANHLFANAKALVFAGAFFEGPEASRWLSKGLSILDAEVREQILSDGGHIERSPLYHSLITEDLLDLVNVGRRYPGMIAENTLTHWGKTASAMLAWLKKMCHPDGRISLFNDCAFDVAQQPRHLHEYAHRLELQSASAALGESGYIRLENDETVVFFDAAPIGADYQPGHAHADALSFELSHRGRRLLVNSGTSTYEPGAVRNRQRGTAAHNTVRIDGLDQSEMWASFRVARRAHIIDARREGADFAEAAHDGYRRLKHPVVHRRSLKLLNRELSITDFLEGTGTHDVEVFFHLHPGADVRIDLDSSLTRSAETTTYHPEFNISIPNTTVVGRWSGHCPQVFVSRIQLA